MQEPFSFHIPYCQYHAFWCPSDLSRQDIRQVFVVTDKYLSGIVLQNLFEH